MAQLNSFSALLKGLRDLTNTKTQTLSNALGYDCTYISKWISGVKLPAAKNAKKNIRDIANFFGRSFPNFYLLQKNLMEAGYLMESEVSKHPDRDWLCDVLMQRCERQRAGRNESNYIPSCCFHKDDALAVLSRAIRRSYERGEKKICLIATADVFSVFGNSFFSVFDTNAHPGLEFNIKIVSVESSLSDAPDLFCHRMIGLLNLPHYPHLTIYGVPSLPATSLIVLPELAMNIILQDGMFLAAFCSDDPKAVSILHRHCMEMFGNLKPIITAASPEALRRTDIQIDGYSLCGNLLFFSGAPSFLVPPEVLGALRLRCADDKVYCKYLERLSQINFKLAPNNSFNVIMYKSFFLEYISDGIIEIGSRRVTLTKDERAAHIAYLADCMERCKEIRIYMINDTGPSVYRHERGLSIFIDPRVCSIERTQNYHGAAFPHYHVSSTAFLLDSLRAYLTDPVKLKECTELNPSLLREYKRNYFDK